MGWWTHRPKGNKLTINHIPNSNVDIGRKKGWWTRRLKGNKLTINHITSNNVAIGPFFVWCPRCHRATYINRPENPIRQWSSASDLVFSENMISCPHSTTPQDEYELFYRRRQKLQNFRNMTYECQKYDIQTYECELIEKGWHIIHSAERGTAFPEGPSSYCLCPTIIGKVRIRLFVFLGVVDI